MLISIERNPGGKWMATNDFFGVVIADSHDELREKCKQRWAEITDCVFDEDWKKTQSKNE